jgi:LPXTG-site transpeptidase (sortase) family protein
MAGLAVALVVGGVAVLFSTGDDGGLERGIGIVRSAGVPVPQAADASVGGVPAAPSGEGETDEIADLVAEEGEPPDATFARVRIPKLGVDAGVSPRTVELGASQMPVPDGPAALAWYDLSAWPGLGGRPGDGGNTILAGHVDYNGEVGYAGRHYRGPGVFFHLHLLAPGDVIEVEYEGEVLRYEVAWVEQLAVSGTDWDSIWSADVERDSITLFTCGGTFDSDARAYSDRLVVRAERV